MSIEHDSLISAISLSPNDRFLASTSWDGTARLWNLENGHISSPLQHAGHVSCVSFSADGELLVTGCSDNAYTWDVSRIVREAGFNDSDLSDYHVSKSTFPSTVSNDTAPELGHAGIDLMTTAEVVQRTNLCYSQNPSRKSALDVRHSSLRRLTDRTYKTLG
jgi:WD40 repeat protein